MVLIATDKINRFLCIRIVITSPGRGGESQIKRTGVLVVPFRG